MLAILRGWPLLAAIAQGNDSRCQQYQLFRTVGSSFIALALVGQAEGVPLSVLDGLIDRFLDKTDPVAHPHALISGRDLIEQLELRPGRSEEHTSELQSRPHISYAVFCLKKKKKKKTPSAPHTANSV